jgi:hypothetical protein
MSWKFDIRDVIPKNWNIVEEGIIKRHDSAHRRFKKAKKAHPTQAGGAILAEGFEEAHGHSRLRPTNSTARASGRRQTAATWRRITVSLSSTRAYYRLALARDQFSSGRIT